MSARRRQNSSASLASRALPHHTRQKSKAAHLEPKSAHVSDPFLQSFLGPTFSPADYLNSTLPSLQTSPRNNNNNNNNNNNDPSLVPLAELSAQAQTQLSQLNAHTTRLTNTLTQLTDEILRSGSRLAYEVELLRGEALSLSEALTDTLHDDVVKFVPAGLQEPAAETRGSETIPSQPTSTSQRRISGATPAPPSTTTTTTTTTTTEETAPGATDDDAARDTTDPAFISQLQTLTLVRARLDTVVKTFGDAMEFVFPPSELSVSSSFLSVSAPEPGSEDRSTEEKGQRVLKQFREEISGLLFPNNNNNNSNNNAASDPVDGIEKAARRIEELRELTTVWDGTAEEKGRTKFVDSLAKMVEDRHKELMREMEQAGRRDGRTDGESGHRRSANGSLDAAAGESRSLSGYGIMSQLQRLRTGL
ncbi:hypothetical protein F5B21DRAFT_473149 [Xylaria acuta]|nr:hypothetical protein F5B21DRAFT_473149 [Xylaria acuta]